MKQTLSWLVVALFLGGVGPIRADLIVNGGFETGDFTGWTTIPGASGSAFGVNATSPGRGYPHSGTYEAYFGAFSTDEDRIYQDLATVAGQSYTIDFWLRNNMGGQNRFDVTWGGGSILSEVNAPGSPSTPYTEYTFTEVASGSTTRLEFAGYNNPSFAFFNLDDVSVNVAAVPEPSNFILAGLGISGFLMAAFARRGQRPQAA